MLSPPRRSIMFCLDAMMGVLLNFRVALLSVQTEKGHNTAIAVSCPLLGFENIIHDRSRFVNLLGKDFKRP